MRPELIKSFLANPAALDSKDVDRSAWEAGLKEIVNPIIAQAVSRGVTGASPLRPAQIRALEGFADKRCTLLLGPPGTGKTATLAWAIVGYLLARQRTERTCRVLVTAFTREAISNLLVAIAERFAIAGAQIAVAFAGPPPDEEPLGVGIVSLRSLQETLSNPHCVVGMTTWSSSKVLNNGWHGGAVAEDAEIFDVVCIDEASQLKVAQGLMSLAPLSDSGRIVVAGDDRQLPPIGDLEEWEVNDRKLGGSFYDFLRSGGVAEYGLSETFRLNRVLVDEPAKLFYQEQYQSAVPERRLQLRPGWKDGLPKWLIAALDPENPVCILLHEGPPTATRSDLEVELVNDIAKALAERLRDSKGEIYGERLWTEGLAVVTPHRAHNAAIRNRFQGVYDDAIVDTVERIQGRERDAIIFSYSVADPEFARIEAPFLFSSERFNVAITRPRSKLIVVVSRRILGVLPADEEVFDSVRVLREYVYGSRAAGDFQHEGLGYPVRVEVRLRRFDDTVPLPEIDTVRVESEAPPEMTADLVEIDAAIRKLADAGQYASARSFDVDKQLDRKVPFSSYRDLFRLGRVILNKEQRENYPPYWRIYPLDGGLIPLPLSGSAFLENARAIYEELRTNLEGVLYNGARQRRGFRDRFCWCDTNGNDLLLPRLTQLQKEGLATLGQATDGRDTVTITRPAGVEPASIPAPTPDLLDDDFCLLNFLEDAEIGRSNLGVFESWFEPLSLLEAAQSKGIKGVANLSIRGFEDALRRLSDHGFILLGDGRVRSRMAELGRELRLVKQRFVPEDQGRRPYLVRSLKIEARTRYKPLPSIPLAEVVDSITRRLEKDPDAARVLQALVPTMRRGFAVPEGQSPLISGFQRSALQSITAEWLAKSGKRGFVITADTGSGKTEAACMPLLFGAALDRVRGIKGARAVLVYPRIRLAVNQAARLAKYAKLLSEELGDVLITVGLQYGEVPQSWIRQRRQYDKAEDKPAELWQPGETSGWRFPFFPCPDCDSELTLLPGDRSALADTLRCEKCSWSFSGWVGSKELLASRPPALFLTVTESLHQWMQNETYGALFGDHQAFAPPRAVLADEIHLYTHTHGANVGWALRRLLGRCKLNGESAPIAIGMSATLGDPREVWERLAGLTIDRIEQIQPAESDRVENPRGREYFYFVQPEIESRGKDIAGASTTIQAVMLLAHGMRRRVSPEGGFRSVVFLDSIDKLKRLHGDFTDAEVRKRLAKLRTSAFGRDAQDPTRLVDRCCGEPRSCSRFREGECWWFAANDIRQRGAGARFCGPGEALVVASRPVYSASGGNVDTLIEGSDVLFSTSSLEVGYDDPEMTLVYQHYAPTNLASFIQRKGRGGRGINDRPLTGITLSLYSPRDSYFFREPDRLLSPTDFRVPVNMDNVFIRRGQALAAILDIGSRAVAQQDWRSNPNLDPAILKTADGFVQDIFGSRLYSELEVKDLADLWEQAKKSAEPPLLPNQQMRDWRLALRDHPRLLYDAPNSASIEVYIPGRPEPVVEDVALALAECAPGRMTRRWGLGEAHWIPINASFGSVDPRENRSFSLDPNVTPETLIGLIPTDAARAIGGRIPSKITRPLALRPQVAGKFLGVDWKAHWGWDNDERVAVPLDQSLNTVPINHKTQGRLLGFATVTVEGSASKTVEVAALAAIGDGKLDVFVAVAGQRSAGLRAAQVFWGSDIEIVQHTIRADRVQHRRIFTSAQDGGPEFVGYGMQPEGIRLRLRSSRIDQFITEEESALKDNAGRARWHRGQYLRYLLMTEGSVAGLTTYDARQLADLCIAAAADPDIREDLVRAAHRGNANRFREALEKARATRLEFHPLLTEQRTERVLERLDAPGVMQAFRAVFDEVKRNDSFGKYLRSVLLHSLLNRLRELYVIHGLGDERKVLAHARLPLQYGPTAEDVLTVCERASGGDGTTRAFVEAAPTVLADWIREQFVQCPNAESDRVVEKAFSMVGEHERWRTRDSRDPIWVAELAKELGVDPSSGAGSMQSILRLLYQSDEVNGRAFDMYYLYREISAVRKLLAAAFGRPPTDWELVSGTVQRARAKSAETPELTELLLAYAGQEEAIAEEGLSPEVRLGELVYRIGTPLCEDGCQACVHTGSDLMPDEIAEAAASRVLLERFGAFIRRN